MADIGWIKLHRKITDNNLWFSEKFTRAQAWIDLLLLANYQDGGFYKRGVWVDVPRGCVGYSEIGLSKRWKWSRDKVRHFLGTLESLQQIRQQKTFVTTVISITNYEAYQQGDTANPTEEKQQTRQQKNTFKESKEIQERKEVKREETLSPEKIASETFEQTKTETTLPIEFLDWIKLELLNRFDKYVVNTTTLTDWYELYQDYGDEILAGAIRDHKGNSKNWNPDVSEIKRIAGIKRSDLRRRLKEFEKAAPPPPTDEGLPPQTYSAAWEGSFAEVLARYRSGNLLVQALIQKHRPEVVSATGEQVG